VMVSVPIILPLCDPVQFSLLSMSSICPSNHSSWPLPLLCSWGYPELFSCLPFSITVKLFLTQPEELSFILLNCMLPWLKPNNISTTVLRIESVTFRILSKLLYGSIKPTYPDRQNSKTTHHDSDSCEVLSPWVWAL
jgi:hypothetical protein